MAMRAESRAEVKVRGGAAAKVKGACGGRGGATARSALGWYRPSVGVPRDVGCRRCIRVANLFSVQLALIRKGDDTTSCERN